MNSEKWFRTLSLAVLCSLLVSILSPAAPVGAAPLAEMAQHRITGVVVVQALVDEAPHHDERCEQALIETPLRCFDQFPDDLGWQQLREHREQFRYA